LGRVGVAGCRWAIGCGIGCGGGCDRRFREVLARASTGLAANRSKNKKSIASRNRLKFSFESFFIVVLNH
jgi:hypothetical protein